MSASHEIRICCNECGYDESERTPSVREARRRLKYHGWSVYCRTLDRCPECTTTAAQEKAK